MTYVWATPVPRHHSNPRCGDRGFTQSCNWPYFPIHKSGFTAIFFSLTSVIIDFCNPQVEESGVGYILYILRYSFARELDILSPTLKTVLRNCWRIRVAPNLTFSNPAGAEFGWNLFSGHRTIYGSDKTNGVNNAVSRYRGSIQFSASFVALLFASYW